MPLVSTREEDLDWGILLIRLPVAAAVVTVVCNAPYRDASWAPSSQNESRQSPQLKTIRFVSPPMALSGPGEAINLVNLGVVPLLTTMIITSRRLDHHRL